MSVNSTENEEQANQHLDEDPDQGGLYCEHNRTEDACEECAHKRAKEQGLPLASDNVYPYGEPNPDGSSPGSAKASGFTPGAA